MTEFLRILATDLNIHLSGQRFIAANNCEYNKTETNVFIAFGDVNIKDIPQNEMEQASFGKTI
jgi:type 1 fimbria pilin